MARTSKTKGKSNTMHKEREEVNALVNLFILGLFLVLVMYLYIV